jgi:hypothetical protein
MKKYFYLNLFLAIVILLNGCSWFAGKPGETGQTGQVAEEARGPEAAKEPVRTQEEMQAYTHRDSAADMAAAGPFYFGNFDGFAPQSQVYSEQRHEKVAEVIDQVDAGIDILGQLDKKLREEKDVFVWYISEIQKIDKSTTKYTNDILNATNISYLSQSLSDLMQLRNTGRNMEESPAWGFAQFQKYGSLATLTNLYSAEVSSLMIRLTTLYTLLEADPEPAYKELNKQLIAKMDPVSDEASDLLSQAVHANAQAAYGDKLVFTADYYFSQDRIKDLDAEIAKIDALFTGYTGGNQNLTPEMLDWLNQRFFELQAYRENLTDYLNSIPATELMPKEELAQNPHTDGLFIPRAYAQDDIPGWVQKKVSDAIKTAKFVKNMGFAAVRVTGQAIKDAWDKSGAHEAVKDGAQILNTGLEVASSGVNLTLQGLLGIYYKDMTWGDFKKKIEAEKQQIYDRFVQGKLGKEQLDEMIHQVDQFQHNTGTFVKNMSDLSGDVTSIVTGKSQVGNFVRDVTKAVGDEVKGTLDTASDFSKNLAVVMHPEMGKKETREALMGLYAAWKETKDKKGEWAEVEIPDFKDLIKDKTKEQAIKEIKDKIKELGLDIKEEKKFTKQLEGLFKDQLKDEETKDDNKKDEKKDGAKKDDTKKDSGGTSDTGKKGTGAGTTPDGTTKSGSDSDPINQIFTNPNLSDKEIRDIILGQILKGLPPLKNKDKDKDKDKEKDEDKDSDGDGIADIVDNCPDISNSDQSDTDSDHIGNACDPDCSGDKDNDTVCNEVDNCPNDANTDQKDSNNNGIGDVCDNSAPALSEIAGSWPGTATITDVYISDELRATSQKEGCDLSELEKSKGQAKPVTMTITPTSETGGTISMSGEDSKNTVIPFTYTDGVLSAAKTDQGATMNFNMSFTGNTSTGSMNVDYMAGAAKIGGSLNLTR